MTATKISDLLPIPEGVKKPHAYQVFGLEGGEQDREKIKAAVQKILDRLKEAKTTTDPKLWRKAANVVDKARGILSDPRKRAALDARFGVIDFGNEVESSSSSPDPLGSVLPNADPLAAALPSSDPLAAVMPAGNPMATVTSPGMAPVGTAPVASAPVPQARVVSAAPPAPAVAETVAPPAAKPIFVKKPSSSTRRKKSSTGTAMLAIFGVGMTAIIVSLGWFLFFSDGHLRIVSEDGKISINTKAPEEKKAEPKRKVTPKPKNTDPVLGNVPASGIADSVGAIAEPFPFPGENGSDSTMEPIENDPGMSEPGMSEPGMSEPKASDPDMEDPAMPETVVPDVTEPDKPETVLPVEPATETAPQEMTPEMIAKADEEIKKVEQLIKSSNWVGMKPAAEKLTAMTLSEEQAAHADALYNLADLATYYRGGIVKGILSRKAAETFEITAGVQVAVVETDEDQIILRVNGRNKVYALNDMPFRLADRLAAFTLPPDKPDNIAAQYCFRAIAEKSSDEYREEALDWLQTLDGDLENVDTKKLVEAIKTIYQ